MRLFPSSATKGAQNQLKIASKYIVLEWNALLCCPGHFHFSEPRFFLTFTSSRKKKKNLCWLGKGGGMEEDLFPGTTPHPSTF